MIIKNAVTTLILVAFLVLLPSTASTHPQADTGQVYINGKGATNSWAPSYYNGTTVDSAMVMWRGELTNGGTINSAEVINHGTIGNTGRINTARIDDGGTITNRDGTINNVVMGFQSYSCKDNRLFNTSGGTIDWVALISGKVENDGFLGNSTITNALINDGTLYNTWYGTITDVTLNGGALHNYSGATITDATINGGQLDSCWCRLYQFYCLQSGQSAVMSFSTSSRHISLDRFRCLGSVSRASSSTVSLTADSCSRRFSFGSAD